MTSKIEVSKGRIFFENSQHSLGMGKVRVKEVAILKGVKLETLGLTPNERPLFS
jgi:hypothetical protein